MMANAYWNNNDPLENQVRQGVKDWEAAPPSDWDTPSDGLWGKIAPPPAQGIASIWKWIFGAMAVTASITVALLWSKFPSQPRGVAPVQAQQSVQPLVAEEKNHSSPLESNTAIIAENPALKLRSSVDEALPATGNESTATKSIRSAKKIGNAIPISALPSNSSASIRQAGDGNTTTPPSSLLPESPRANLLPVAASNNETHIPLEMQDRLEAIADMPVSEEVISFRPFAPVSFLDAAPIPVLGSVWGATTTALNFVPHQVRRAPRSGFFFGGLAVSPNRTFRQIQSSRPADQLPAYLKENEFASWTTEFGTRIGWKPNRHFALSTGLSLYNMRQQSLHRFRIPFDPGRERPVGNNNLEGYYNLTVPSAYGDATVEVGMRRPVAGQAIPAGQFIALEMTTNLNISYVTVPLHAYYFLNAGRWSVGLKGGGALNFLQEERLNVSARIAFRGLESRTVAVRRSAESIKRVVPDYHIGAALWYRPSPGWMLSLEPSFRHSLQPVIKREAFNVSQYAWGVQLGVQKVF